MQLFFLNFHILSEFLSRKFLKFRLNFEVLFLKLMAEKLVTLKKMTKDVKGTESQ